jgi:hypothetical protein
MSGEARAANGEKGFHRGGVTQRGRRLSPFESAESLESTENTAIALTKFHHWVYLDIYTYQVKG